MIQSIKRIEDIANLSTTPVAMVIAKTKMCSVCAPVAKRLIEEMADYPTVPLYEVYIEDVPAFRGQYMVFTVPTILLFFEGKEIHRESRFIDFNRIHSLLSKIL